MDYDIEGCQRIANAIVILTANDYRKALRALKRNPRNKAAMKIALACEEFFDSDWMKILTEVEGEWLKQELRKEVVQS